MNCTQARFLLYAYLDRDISSSEAEALSRHLVDCRSCEARARSARGLASLLKSRVSRTNAPIRLRERLRHGEVHPARFRYPLAATAAVVLFLLVPLVADVSGLRGGIEPIEAADALGGASAHRERRGTVPEAALVSRRMTGTLVCLDCEARIEAGLCPLPEAQHEAAFCADNGEVWRLMPRDPAFDEKAAGQTLTVEGIGFPQSGFLRANRVGY
jgi:hypothetical protein